MRTNRKLHRDRECFVCVFERWGGEGALMTEEYGPRGGRTKAQQLFLRTLLPVPAQLR